MKATYLYLAAVSLLGWGCTDSPTMIEGTLEGIEADSVFLYEVVNEHYGSLKYKEAIPVTEGKFSISADSLAPQLYALSTESERTSGYVQTFAKAFLAPSQTDIVLSRDPYGQLQIHASGPALTEGYQAFMDGLADVENVLPAYHMNKKRWLTVILDEQEDFDTQLIDLVDKSYTLVASSKKTL